MDSGRSNARSPRGAALAVVERLQQSGFTAYFAGGCVRDELLGLEPKDYDVATDARPEQAQALFRNTRSVGESFGVVLVHIHGHSIEVATFRADLGYSDRRRPDQVVFTSAEEDAKRRDFTINGLFEDPVHDHVIDYVGGEADLKAGIIRAIGRPAERLAEDHLRALRAVRFAARFGFAIEPDTAEAIRRDAIALQGVSRERIGQEVRLMLTHPSRAAAADLLQQLSLDAPSLDEETQRRPVSVLAELPAEIDYPTALAAWSIDRGLDRRRATSRWRDALMLSNHERDQFASILRDLESVRSEWDGLSVARRKRLAARAHFDRVLALLRAIDGRQGRSVGDDVERLAKSSGGLAPAPLLTGDDLVAMGLAPGPQFKKILDAVYDAQLEGRIASAQEARSLARQVESERPDG